MSNALKQVLETIGIELHRTYNDKRWILKERKALIRPSIRAIYKTFDRDLVGVEIGVLRGKNAEVMLNVLPLKTLYLIDPYLEYEDYQREGKDRSQQSMNKNKTIAHNNLAQYDTVKKVWIEKLSGEAVTDIEEKVDYVYIDGNHFYKYVKNDIANYYPLLKRDGVLAGHDFNWHGVTQAVQEFICRTGHLLHVGKIGGGIDWWIYKNNQKDGEENEN